MSLEIGIDGMVDGVSNPEDNRLPMKEREYGSPSPGSESMACNKSQCVNVGDPYCSAREAVPINKHNGEDIGKVIWESDEA